MRVGLVNSAIEQVSDTALGALGAAAPAVASAAGSGRDWFGDLWVYWAVVVLMMIGLYTVIASSHLLKKLIGLSIFQTAVILFFVAMAKVEGGTAPILWEGNPEVLYSNPLPHALMLTAIVVSVATTAVGLALVVRLHESYGTLEEDDIRVEDRERMA
ncbi:MAG: cation:proton antiporter subunit C [Acidobacteriota bacterium]